MKKSMLAALAAVIVTASVQAQSTVDSIAAKYKLQPMPAARSLEQAFPAIGSYQLENSTEGTGTVTVSLDPANKGIIWVEGLPQGKIKAYLKKSPATYRILSQKAESGKQVQEGTLHYDTTSHQLHIALGKAYDEADPTSIFGSASGVMNTSMDMSNGTGTTGNTKTKSKTPAGKTKAKVVFYTATKVMPDNMMMDNNMQQTDSTQQQSDSTSQQQ